MTMTALEETKEGKTKEEKTEKVDGLVEHIMQEARMVLPGVQALFGFQLVCVFSQGFAQIPRIDQYIHVLAIFLSINAFCFRVARRLIVSALCLTRMWSFTPYSKICALLYLLH